jgi:hypothetical protein
VAAAAEPGSLTTIFVAPDVELVLVDGGPTTLRFGAAIGLRAASIALRAPDFEHSASRPGSAAAADLDVWPHLTLMHHVGRDVEIGASAGVDVAVADVTTPAWNAAFIVALR